MPTRRPCGAWAATPSVPTGGWSGTRRTPRPRSSPSPDTNPGVRGPDRQRAIYSAGVSGTKPRVPTDAVGLEAAAETAMADEAYAYVAGGAGTGQTIAANRADFDAWRIVPRMLRVVGDRDPSVELFGRRFASPWILCPIGVL